MVCLTENNEEIGNRSVCDEDLRTVYDKLIALSDCRGINGIEVVPMIQLRKGTTDDGFAADNAGQIRLLLSLAPISRDYLGSRISVAEGNTKP
jgi:hypothetical protein